MALPNFVVVEGLDGVGKTTLAKFLQDKLDYIYMYSIPQKFIDLRHELLASVNAQAKFLYYLSGILAMQDELREHLKQGNRVVIDRYIYTTLAYHQALQVDTSFISMTEFPIVWPDRCLLLVVSEESRMKRLGKNKKIEPHEVDTQYMRLAQKALISMTGMSVIDTNEKTADVVFEEVKIYLYGV